MIKLLSFAAVKSDKTEAIYYQKKLLARLVVVTNMEFVVCSRGSSLAPFEKVYNTSLPTTGTPRIRIPIPLHISPLSAVGCSCAHKGR